MIPCKRLVPARTQTLFAPSPLPTPATPRCEACKRLVPARKQMLLYDDPNVLVIHLKRFDGFHGGKIGGHVGFGDTLGESIDFSCTS